MLAILRTLNPHINFKISLSIFIFKNLLVFELGLHLLINLGTTDIIMMLSSSHWTLSNFHLFKLFFFLLFPILFSNFYYSGPTYILLNLSLSISCFWFYSKYIKIFYFPTPFQYFLPGLVFLPGKSHRSLACYSPKGYRVRCDWRLNTQHTHTHPHTHTQTHKYICMCNCGCIYIHIHLYLTFYFSIYSLSFVWVSIVLNRINHIVSLWQKFTIGTCMEGMFHVQLHLFLVM